MATEAQPATQAKRILIVEDELMIRMLLEDMLGELGYTVAAEAARIDEALEVTKNAGSKNRAGGEWVLFGIIALI